MEVTRLVLHVEFSIAYKMFMATSLTCMYFQNTNLRQSTNYSSGSTQSVFLSQHGHCILASAKHSLTGWIYSQNYT